MAEEKKTKAIEDMSTEELKVLSYDMMVQAQQLQGNMQKVQQLILVKQQEGKKHE